MHSAQELLRDDFDHVLQHTREIAENLRGAEIFVTGGTGFFGRWLVETFCYLNARLRLEARMLVLSRDPATFQAQAPHLCQSDCVSFVRGDVRELDADRVFAQLEDRSSREIAFVIHAATDASARLNDENPRLMFDTIVEGTRAALDFATAVGARRFLFTSSGAVYGRQPPEVTHLPEQYLGGPDPTDPGFAYAEAKRAAEMLCACAYKQHGLETVIARCFAFVGPFMRFDAHFAIGNFIRDALSGGPIHVSGDGTPLRSYLYASDLVVWLWTMLTQAPPSRPYNVGSSVAISIAELADAVRRVIDATIAVEIAKPPDPNLPPPRYVPATHRAQTELALIQRVPLDEAISRTAAYLRQTAIR